MSTVRRRVFEAFSMRSAFFCLFEAAENASEAVTTTTEAPNPYWSILQVEPSDARGTGTDSRQKRGLSVRKERSGLHWESTCN